MDNSIEAIWKEGFLNEKSLVAPKINDLYNQRSKHLVDKMKRMYKITLVALVIMAIVFPIWYYFLGGLWQGIAIAILFLLTALYSYRQNRSIKTLEQGATSLDYLKSFNGWLKDTLSKNEKVLRFTYPLYFLIATSTMWSAWNKGEKPIQDMKEQFPGSTFIGNVPLFVWIIVTAITILIFYFSARIYRWDVRLLYGRIFRKLEETINEMEKLKDEE